MLKMDVERSVLVLVDYWGQLMPAINGAEAVVEAALVLFEWVRPCRHPQFKTVLELVKRRTSASLPG
ncbi:hypothetical protein [Azohydromonas aeria]|uniref:hypothetical protein n=1 Tax=Azohydromonas aeria TaxID=2590212 RepID=UPI0012F819BB|nr:hypothetical protein [Azohydromonas aeria]